MDACQAHTPFENEKGLSLAQPRKKDHAATLALSVLVFCLFVCKGGWLFCLLVCLVLTFSSFLLSFFLNFFVCLAKGSFCLAQADLELVARPLLQSPKC